MLRATWLWPTVGVGRGALLPTEEARDGWWEGRGAEWAGGKSMRALGGRAG